MPIQYEAMCVGIHPGGTTVAVGGRVCPENIVIFN
jgi:hypothetical protein